ncbi:MAG: hypothetical protein HY274_03150 [Gammaproteobacteria bacterium]|nr:hypothetical protein [Gammaproteobacteria bacterium]
MAAMASNIKKKIYIPLLDEGVPVLRPTLGIDLGGNIFEVLPTDGYDPEDEEWEFSPGTIVECVLEIRDGEQVLVAKKKIANSKN